MSDISFGVGSTTLWDGADLGKRGARIYLCVYQMLTRLIAMPAVVVRQRKAWRRRDGVFLYFEVSMEPIIY